MKKICKKFKIFGLLLMLVFAMAGAASVSNPVRVEAASKKGFQTIGGKQYYIAERRQGKRLADADRQQNK